MFNHFLCTPKLPKVLVVMDTISTNLQHLEVLVESIVKALKEEREALLLAQQQFESVHLPHFVVVAEHACSFRTGREWLTVMQGKPTR